MNKLLILLSTALLVQISGAISLGDTLDKNIASRSDTTTSATKLVKSDNNSLVFQNTSLHGKMRILVNKETSKVYQINWQDKRTINAKDILGDKYYPEFKNAKIQNYVRFRGISVADGNLTFSQFGSMLSGIQGMASVHSLAPHE